MTNEQIESLAKKIESNLELDNDFEVGWNELGIKVLIYVDRFKDESVKLDTNHLTEAEYRVYENLIKGFGVSEPIGTARAMIVLSGWDYWCDTEANNKGSNNPSLSIFMLAENIKSEWHAVEFIEDVAWQFEQLILPLFA